MRFNALWHGVTCGVTAPEPSAKTLNLGRILFPCGTAYTYHNGDAPRASGEPGDALPFQLMERSAGQRASLQEPI